MGNKPTDGMKTEAQRGLDWRSEFGRGGTEVGIARARDIVNDRDLSDDTVKRMYSFFSRHEVDKQAEGFRPGEDGYPSNGRIAWALWGGDAGYSWSKDKVKGMERAEEFEFGYDERPFPNEHAARLHDPSKYVSFRRRNDAGGPGIDFIFGILAAGGTELQAIRFDKKRYTVAQAKAWLKDHDHTPIMFEEATGERAVDSEYGASCPVATHDDAVNMRNHLICIEQANLGPADPTAPSDEYWQERAKIWMVSVDEARVRQCQNCEYYHNNPKMLDCVKSSTLKASDLPVEPKWADVALPSGYCTKWDITCTSTRTCDTWEPQVMVEDDNSEAEDMVQETTDMADPMDRKAAPEIIHRANAMDAKVIDEATRSVHIAVSSELPVERSFGKEILDHSEGSIDMEFLRSGRAPLLLDHDPEKQIGVIESVTLDGDRVLRSKVRFGRSALAQEVYQDVLDGIRGNVSVGYRVNKMERDMTDKNAYRVKSWSPMEVSVVSIPADPSVGVGRSTVAPEPEPKVEPSVKKDTTMSEVNLDAVRAEAAKAAADNAAEIVKLGQRHNRSDLAAAAIGAGKSVDQFRGELLEVIGNTPLDNKEIGLTKKEVRQFSVVRAIRALANPTDRAAQDDARFELEASQAAARAYGQTAQGIMLPADVLGSWKQRDLNTSDDNEIVATNLMAGDFIDVLRNQSSVMQAGARMMPGLVGNVAIPKKTAASTAGWISTEGGAASESEPTFGTVSLTPKTVGAFTDITRQLMLQSTPAVEGLVRDDLTQAVALAIDAGALKGAGSSGQPTGLYATSGINTDSFAGATPTWAEIVGLETLVAEDNALLGNLAYIAPASLYGTLKTTAKANNQAIFAVDPDGTMNGYRTIVSNQATAGYLLFGNFSDCLIGMWGGVDLLVDPYTSSTTGSVRIRILQSVDVAVRHAVSFALGTPAA
jgi:HK97 family phage major capsid protein/HK97 family phage prohead protease